MIVRSLPRKTASFRQLYRYINQDQTIPYSILWNLNTHNPYEQEKIVKQFYNNADLLTKGKRRNYLYHDIISMTLAPGVPLDHQMQALRDLALKYIQGRGQNLLAYGRMHLKGKNLHIHLMLSANELGKKTRQYLSRNEFGELKKQCERYIHQQYPELKQPVIFCKERTEKPNKSRQREYEYTRRTGKKTQKQQIKEILADLLEQDRSSPLKQHLKAHNFEIYQRGKHMGVVFDGTKYRLGTLGLREAFAESLSRPVRTSTGKDPEAPSSYTEQPQPNQTHTQTNMNKIYEEMKRQQEQKLEEECDKRATAFKRNLREALKRAFPDRKFRVYRALNSIAVEIFLVHRSVHFKPKYIQDFVFLKSDEERQQHRQKDIKSKLSTIVDDLVHLHEEEKQAEKRYTSEQQKPVEQVKRSNSQNEPELGL